MSILKISTNISNKMSVESTDLITSIIYNLKRNFSKITIEFFNSNETRHTSLTIHFSVDRRTTDSKRTENIY